MLGGCIIYFYNMFEITQERLLQFQTFHIANVAKFSLSVHVHTIYISHFSTGYKPNYQLTVVCTGLLSQVENNIL